MSKTNIVGELKKGSGVVRVQAVTFKGRPRVDIREFFRREDGTLAPTRKGVSLVPEDALKLRKQLRLAVKRTRAQKAGE